ncbi:MAG: hypothetical protein ACM3UV_05320 [Nocardioidaceae bacterium]
MLSIAAKRSLASALAGAALASALIVADASADPSFQDLRSADAADAGRAAVDPPSSVADPSGDDFQDLRSADTRDYAADLSSASEPQAVAAQPARSGGFDVVSALLGAAAGTGLLIVLIAAVGLVRRRPSPGRHGSVGA